MPIGEDEKDLLDDFCSLVERAFRFECFCNLLLLSCMASSLEIFRIFISRPLCLIVGIVCKLKGTHGELAGDGDIEDFPAVTKVGIVFVFFQKCIETVFITVLAFCFQEIVENLRHFFALGVSFVKFDTLQQSTADDRRAECRDVAVIDFWDFPFI